MTNKGEETPELLRSIRRLPQEIAREHAGETRITLAQYLREYPEGVFQACDDQLDDFFPSLEEYAAFIKSTFVPDIDTLVIPYTLRPCLPQRVDAPNADSLLDDAYSCSESPVAYDKEQTASLQSLLNWWFEHNTKPWWDLDLRRVIVLSPEERCLLFKLITGEEYKGSDKFNEPELEPSTDFMLAESDDADAEDESDEEAPPDSDATP